MPPREGRVRRELGWTRRRLRILGRSRSASSWTAQSATVLSSAQAGLTDRAQPESSLPPDLLDGARDKVALLLAEIERLRPGLTRHRALDVNSGSGSLLQALCERFDECDGMSQRIEIVRAAEGANRHGERCRYVHLGEGQAFPFPDETFDFVHCGTLLRGGDDSHAWHVIVETVRVLRLLGIAVIDFTGGDELQREPLALGGAEGQLDARVSAPERLSSVAGEPAELTITITNTGLTVLGSPINPLRLEGYWDRRRGAQRPAAVAEIDRIVLPGDSVAVGLAVSTPSDPGIHVLELSLASADPWAERRSPATVVAIAVDTSLPGGRHHASAGLPSGLDEPVTTAVARADGVILSSQILTPGPGALPRERYFFARA